jgi:hypothetical protein
VKFYGCYIRTAVLNEIVVYDEPFYVFRYPKHLQKNLYFSRLEGKLVYYCLPVLVVLRVGYLYSSPNIIRMFKSRRMKWAGHVARIRETKNAYRILMGKQEGKRPLG